jgi:hypothetical protein
MALTVIGGSNFLGRYLIKSLSSQYEEVRLADMYPHRDSVYKLQESLGSKLKKFVLSYPASLKHAISGSSRLIIIDHDYFKLAHSKHFYLEKSLQFAEDLGVSDITWVHPLEFTHLSQVEGDPSLLVNQSESKARKIHPDLKSIRTSLIFGPNALSLILHKALEDLSSKKPVITSNSGLTHFAPVFEEDFLSAFNSLQPGESSSIEGPERLTYEEIVWVLAQSLGVAKPSHTGILGMLTGKLAMNDFIGDVFYPSHLQQLYRLVARPEELVATVQGKTKLAEYFKPSTPRPVSSLHWHRVILD